MIDDNFLVIFTRMITPLLSRVGFDKFQLPPIVSYDFAAKHLRDFLFTSSDLFSALPFVETLVLLDESEPSVETLVLLDERKE